MNYDREFSFYIGEHKICVFVVDDYKSTSIACCLCGKVNEDNIEVNYKTHKITSKRAGALHRTSSLFKIAEKQVAKNAGKVFCCKCYCDQYILRAEKYMNVNLYQSA